MLLVGFVSFALGCVSFMLKSRWEERRADRRTRRMIARALIPDLIAIRCSMIGVGNPIKWDSVEFPPNEWPKYRDDLAEAISVPAEWATISGAFEEVGDIPEEATRHYWSEQLDELDEE